MPKVNIQDFDDLINGLDLIANKEDSIIDIFQLELSCDKYTEFAPGVCAREITSLDDTKYDHEKLGAKALSRIGKNWKGRLMWCTFEAGKEMILQAHPQKERAFVIFGIFEDIHNNRKAEAGEVMEFRRMEKHRPCCPVETLLLLHFF